MSTAAKAKLRMTLKLKDSKVIKKWRYSIGSYGHYMYATLDSEIHYGIENSL